MLIYHKNIPSEHLEWNFKKAQIIPEQSISESVVIYKDALPYIKCQLVNTIQHESAHRQDEQTRNEEIIDVKRSKKRNRSIMPFDQFSAKNRVEPIAEKAEQQCVYPTEISNETISINLDALFNEAKNSANVDPSFKNDIKAGTLQPSAQGMYLMQNLPEQIAIKDQVRPNQYEGFDGSLWIDVRKIVNPFVVTKTINPPTFNDDGITPDTPGVSQMSPIPGAITDQSRQTVPAIPSTPSMQGR